MNIEIFGNLLLLYARRYIYKNRIHPHPPIPTSPLTPLFPVFPVILTPLRPLNKRLNITYTPLIQYILYIYYSYTTTFNSYLIQPSNFHSHSLNVLLDLHHYNHNKTRTERKPELPSFTINHFLILIINFSLHLVHPTVAVLSIQI